MRERERNTQKVTERECSKLMFLVADGSSSSRKTWDLKPGQLFFSVAWHSELLSLSRSLSLCLCLSVSGSPALYEIRRASYSFVVYSALYSALNSCIRGPAPIEP